MRRGPISPLSPNGQKNTGWKSLQSYHRMLTRTDIVQFQENKISEKFGVSPADFSDKVPFSDKETLSCLNLGHPPVIGFTSGTTIQTNINYWNTNYFNEQMSRDWHHQGLREGDYIIIFGLSTRGSMRYSMSMYEKNGVIPIFIPHHPKYIPEVIEAIRKYKPKVFNLLSNPMIMAFENYFENNNIDPVELFSCFDLFHFGGEHMSDRYKELVKSWQIDIIECTSVGDRYAAFECKERNGFHVYEDLLYIETIDDEMVVTSLYDTPEPFVRFKTGDIIKKHTEPCKCGSPHMRFEVLGRKTYQVKFQNKSIFPLDVQRIVETIPETRSGIFQIKRPREGANVIDIIVGYEKDKLNRDLSDLKNELESQITSSLNIPNSVELVDVKIILQNGPLHKVKRVI